MMKLLAIFTLVAVSLFGQATTVQQAAAHLDACNQVTAGVGSTGGTTTLTLNPGGLTVYICSINISNCSDATGGPVAAVSTVTTTNLGSAAYTLGSGSTTTTAPGGPGLCNPDINTHFPNMLRAAAPGTSVTFVLPQEATHQVIRANIHWMAALPQ